jgi:ADP-heptose:LPS heptosyltransferase
MARTIIIIHPGGIGDVLLAVPAMQRLRGRFPQHQSLLVANESVGRLLRDAQQIDAFMSMERAAVADLFAGSLPVAGPLTRWIERCDFAVAWMQDEEGTLAAVLRSCGVREARILSPFCLELKARHQSDRFLETLGEPEGDGSIDTCLRMPGHLVEQGQAHLERVGIPADRPFALVHPGSGSRHKCISPGVLVPAIQRLRAEGVDPLLIEGPVDGDTVADLLRLMSANTTVLRGLDLALLAGVIAHAELYLGHDSGVTHLSGLLGVPTVALFGPTDSERWAPRGGHVTVLRGAPCECPSWELVKACVARSCLVIPVEQLIALCRVHREEGATSRNPLRCALSPPTPYARVTS